VKLLKRNLQEDQRTHSVAAQDNPQNAIAPEPQNGPSRTVTVPEHLSSSCAVVLLLVRAVPDIQPFKKLGAFMEAEGSLPFRKSPPLVPILSQVNQVHTLLI
jgi:hypothetical protein